MNTVTLNESVVLPDNTRLIELQISKQGVRVVLEDRYSPGYDTQAASLQWDELDDVEFLSDRFDTEAVRTFKVLVEMLGRAYANRHIYEALV